MANPNNPFGFRTMLTTMSGVPPRVAEYGKPSTDGNFAIFQNDLVQKAASSVAVAAGGNPAPGIQSAANGTPGTTLYQGVSLNYGALSTATLHYVVDEPMCIFMAQVDSTTNITTASHAGKNANALCSTAGNALTKQSAMSVNHSTIAGTAGLDLRILRVSNLQPNAEGIFAIVEVIILKHELAQGTAGV